MSIILQSTVGGFSAQFMRKLPLVEQAMRDHGLDPSEFVISKDYASTATIPIMGPFFFNYSVYFGEETFTVTEPDLIPWGHASGRDFSRRCEALRVDKRRETIWHCHPFVIQTQISSTKFVNYPGEIGTGAYGARTRNLCRDRAAL